MPRLPSLTREALPAEHQHVYDAIAQSRGAVSNLFAVLLNSPDLAARVGNVGAYLRFESHLKPWQRELTILTTAREMNIQYEWTQHSRTATSAGVRQEAIEAIRDKKGLQALLEGERIIVGYAQELIRNRTVSNETFERARQELGTAGVTDLTMTVGYYTMLGLALGAFQVELDTGLKPLLPV